MLGELDVDPRLSETVLTHHERRGSRRPLVDSKDAARHAYTGYQTAELTSGPRHGDQRAPPARTGSRTRPRGTSIGALLIPLADGTLRPWMARILLSTPEGQQVV